VADAFVKLILCVLNASRAASMSLGVHVLGPLLFFPSFVGVVAVDEVEMLLPSVMYCNCPF
jgi:mannose/fructose/N-acetylgalactosamine-specific phosphotransferase system component IID